MRHYYYKFLKKKKKPKPFWILNGMWFVSRQTNFICRKPHNYQTTLFLFRGLYRLGHKQALLKPGSTGLLLSVFLPPNVRHREAVVLASGSGPPLPCPEAPSAMQVGTVLLAWLLPTHQVLTGLTSVFSLPPQRKSVAFQRLES